MKSRLSILAAALCLLTLFAGPRPGSAQELAPPEPEWLGPMLQAGWRKVQEGVLQRDGGEGRTETFTYGTEGLRWATQRLRERVRSLELEQDAHPSTELSEILTTLNGELTEMDTSLSAPQPEAPGGGEAATGCEASFAVHANADPLSGSLAPGVTANADASYSSPCSDNGNVYSYAYARATSGSTMTTRIQEDPKFDGLSLSSIATASVSGLLDCYSEAYARAWSPALGQNYEVSDTNFSCQPIPTDQTPYRGEPFAVPGTIKAADFDNGGEGVAYHEAAPVSGGSYRTTTVRMYDDNVLYLDAGEWLEYTIDVERAGVYTLVAQVGAEQPGGSFHVELDGVNVTGPIAVPNTGVWNHWGSAIKAGVSFPAGRHVLRVAADSWFDSFYSLRIVVAQAPFGGTVRTFPGTVKAADFDEGGEQISYHDTSADCQGSCGYRLADVDRWDEVVWHTASGEWMEYAVDVTASGTYTLALRVGAEDGGAIFHVEFNGVNVTGPLTMPTTGGWNVLQTVTKTGVSLTAGRKVMRIVIDDSAGAYDAGSFDTISIQP